jgi:hypothetical protein
MDINARVSIEAFNGADGEEKDLDDLGATYLAAVRSAILPKWSNS